MSHSLSSWISSCIQMLCNISPWTSYTMPTSIRFRVIHVFAQYTPRESTTPILHHCHTNAWRVYAFNSTCKLIHYWTEPNRSISRNCKYRSPFIYSKTSNNNNSNHEMRTHIHRTRDKSVRGEIRNRALTGIHTHKILTSCIIQNQGMTIQMYWALSEKKGEQTLAYGFSSPPERLYSIFLGN